MTKKLKRGASQLQCLGQSPAGILVHRVTQNEGCWTRNTVQENYDNGDQRTINMGDAASNLDCYRTQHTQRKCIVAGKDKADYQLKGED